MPYPLVHLDILRKKYRILVKIEVFIAKTQTKKHTINDSDFFFMTHQP